jgi:acetate kinase
MSIRQRGYLHETPSLPWAFKYGFDKGCGVSIGRAILVLNAGSSSLKLALYEAAASLTEMVRGEIEDLDSTPHFVARDTSGRMLAERRWSSGEPPDFGTVLAVLLQFVDDRLHGGQLIAVGHRVVLGGIEHIAPEIVTKDLLQALQALTSLDPLHLPHNLAPMRAIAVSHPALAQVACFDTAFHHTMPPEASHFALPRALTEAGVRRYGFHGLSYEFIVERLRANAPVLARGKVIAAHLGSGASLCALKAGASIATTMGFSVLDGLVMATRCGTLDPGVILYLTRQGKSLAEIEDLLYRRSGLLGVSGVSGDMRVLIASDDPRAREAINLFTYRVATEVGGFVSALGGLDGLVFTAGIGEGAPAIRATICERLSWLGLELDPVANAANADRISSGGSKIEARVIATDEEATIARHTETVVARAVARRGALPKGSDLDISAGSPEVEAAFASERELWRAQGKTRRLWAGDASLWAGGDEGKWLGWLGIVEKELRDLDPLRRFASESWRREIKDILLLGMGGSSLGAEVLAEIFGPQPGRPKFHMLDSTDPAQIRTIEHAIDLAHTLFFVSSKSGATLEPDLFLRYFRNRVETVLGPEKAGEAFVAVTDPGSPLEGLAKTLRFAHIFKGEPSIGGRYSVLSKFGLAPSAAIGIDVERLLEAARPMQRSCGPDAPPAENPGLVLGVALGIAATCFRRDKVTIFASEGLAPFGAWLEQLLAESTGKSGRGLIPLAGEPVAGPERYGADRFFVHLRLAEEEDAAQVDAVAALASAGHPVARISVKDVWSLGGEFFRWEVAVAFAGSILAIDPFNQPDVEASKLNTRAMMEDYARTRSLPSETPIFRANGLALYADPRNARELGRHNGVRDYLRSHFSRVNAGGPAGDYVALLAYLERNEAHTRTLTAMRGKIRDKTRAATCLGFGPRFQHSTGQAFKGGPNSGVFLQITCDDPEDIDIPGRAYSFGVVKVAQGAGDLAALVERGRRVLRVHLKDVDTGLAELSLALDEALA